MRKIAVIAAVLMGAAPFAVSAQDSGQVAAPDTLPVQEEVAAPITLAEVTQDQVLAACATAGSTEESCKAAIASYFAYLESTGVVGANFEQAIADLVVALAETPNAPEEVRAVIVAAIEDIGTNYAVGEQQDAILVVAQTVATGDPIETGTLIIPVPSSPA